MYPLDSLHASQQWWKSRDTVSSQSWGSIFTVLVLVLPLLSWSCVSSPRHLTTVRMHHSWLTVTTSWLMYSAFVLNLLYSFWSHLSFGACRWREMDKTCSWSQNRKSRHTVSSLESDRSHDEARYRLPDNYVTLKPITDADNRYLIFCQSEQRTARTPVITRRWRLPFIAADQREPPMRTVATSTPAKCMMPQLVGTA